MPMTLEYLERCCAINELVLHDLGLLVAAHLPALQPQLHQIGESWDMSIDKLNAEFPDALPAKGA